MLACFALKGIPRKNRRPHQPRVLCVGWLVAQRIFAPNIRPTKNPPVRPYFKNKKITKRNSCSFSARKHPTPPGTGTGTNGSSGLGSAPALGTRQFSQALLAVGPPVETDPREKNPGMPQVRTRPRFCFFYHSFQGFFQNPRSEMRLQRLMHSMSLAAGNSPPRFTGALQAPKVAPSRSASVCFFR